MADDICGVLPAGVIVQQVLFQVIIVHEIVIHRLLRVLQHVKSDVVWIIIIRLKVITFHLGVFEPLISILKHLII